MNQQIGLGIVGAVVRLAGDISTVGNMQVDTSTVVEVGDEVTLRCEASADPPLPIVGRRYMSFKPTAG